MPAFLTSQEMQLAACGYSGVQVACLPGSSKENILKVRKPVACYGPTRPPGSGVSAPEHRSEVRTRRPKVSTRMPSISKNEYAQLIP